MNQCFDVTNSVTTQPNRVYFGTFQNLVSVGRLIISAAPAKRHCCVTLIISLVTYSHKDLYKDSLSITKAGPCIYRAISESHEEMIFNGNVGLKTMKTDSAVQQFRKPEQHIGSFITCQCVQFSKKAQGQDVKIHTLWRKPWSSDLIPPVARQTVSASSNDQVPGLWADNPCSVGQHKIV